jgi:VPDSG-CTERM motif
LLELNAKPPMKLLIPLLLLAVNAAHSTITSIDWIEDDSYSRFDARITGVGLPYVDTITSPSGLWQLYTKNVGFLYETGNPEVGTMIATSIYATLDFLGGSARANHSEASAYLELFPASLTSFGSGAVLLGIFPDNAKTRNDFWEGQIFLAVTSIPDLSDNSTWTWVANYHAVGGSLRPVPDSGTTFGLFSFALAGVLLLKRAKDFCDG